MGFGMLKRAVAPLAMKLLSTNQSCFPVDSLQTPFSGVIRHFYRLTSLQTSLLLQSSTYFTSLADTRLPKRRPSERHRRKRASLKPRGPFAWIMHKEGEPMLPNTPNKGSVKRRNAKKRRLQRLAFILSETRKRKAQLCAARKRKYAKLVERKKAAVEREKAWVERLKQLKQLEEDKAKITT